MADELTVTVEVDDDTDEVRLPEGLVEMFSEGDEPPATVVADILQVAFTQRAHSVVHHGHGEADEEMEAIEDHALDLFEERFGQTFEEATGHSH
ncbi:MAG: hypothetical protein ABEJ68_00690 [Halobacteriaceae archaeon]